MERPEGVVSINKSVAYYISTEQRAQQVTTPGGGGDKVTYKPYKDMESGLYAVLSNVFGDVTALNSPADSAAIAKHNVAYIVTPEITTDSSSDSAMTWPPTRFTVTLTCNVTDVAGQAVLSRKVVGEGHAEFSEFKHDFSLSSKRATEDALLKMQTELLRAPELHQ